MPDERKSLRGIEKGRAEKAYEAVKQFAAQDEKTRKEYKSYVKKIPMLIKTNGLAATLAFISGKKDPYPTIYAQIEGWLKVSPLQYKPSSASERLPLLKDSLTWDSMEYRMYTQEILAFTGWLKRLSDGVLRDG